ncbi:MAG: hypothetical protein LBT63_03145 [Holosporaceae bacterium]|jgi:undecaprenyl-diphosphatase|nr:hypothetical protein [Holosporaceae bacterium]
MLDAVAHFVLKFSHITFIIPLVMVGMIFHRRDLYAKAICFVFVVMIFNALLKQWFKVPLFPHLGPGYAFPSGHMHAAAVFYGYIIYKVDNRALRVTLLFLLCCFGLSLIQCRFHDLFDVTGAAVFAFAEILLCRFISLKFGEKALAAVAMAVSLSSMVILFIIYQLQWHVWLAFYALTGTIFSLNFIEDRKNRNLPQKLLSLTASVLLTAAVYFIFKALAFKDPFLSEIRFALLPTLTMGSINLCSRVNFKTSAARF